MPHQGMPRFLRTPLVAAKLNRQVNIYIFSWELFNIIANVQIGQRAKHVGRLDQSKNK